MRFLDLFMAISSAGADTNSLPDMSDLMDLDFALDGRPWVGVAARSNIDTEDLDYALDGRPFIGVAT